MAITTCLSKITLSVNGLNAPIKRQMCNEDVEHTQGPAEVVPA